jgi:outer membrane protein assembly factor BamB
MTRVLDIWRSWSSRQRLTAAGLAALALLGAILAAYLILKRPGDEECKGEECVLIDESNKPAKVVKAVNWPFYGYDRQRTRFLPVKRLNPPFRAAEWSFQAGKLLEFSPVLADGILYFIDKDALLYAMDTKRGKVIWKRDYGALNASSPAYADGRLFAVNLEPGQAFALRAKDGKLLWRHPFPGRTETSPMVHGDKVIVGTEPGQVVALDVKNGKTVWEASTAGAVKGGLALDDGVLYGANYAGEVFAIRARDGEFVWRSSTSGLSFGRGAAVYSTPAVAHGRVFLGAKDRRIYSFDQKTGEIAWSHSTGHEVYAGPAVADPHGAPPTVYIGSQDQNFYALDARTGNVRWQKDVGGHVLGAASVVSDTVYVAVIGPNIGTLGFDARSGKKVFEHELGEYNPVISDGNRVYLTGTSSLRAFEPKDPKKGKGGKGGKNRKGRGDNGR